METKREKFVRIAETRTNKIIDMIKLLGNCSNKNAYEYTEKDINEIFSAIEKELKVARKKFENQGEDSPTRFTLKNK